MILWLNGPFGAGKTTTARALLRARPDLVEFDTELLGYALRPALAARRSVEDFQDWAAWRALVVTALTEIARAEVGHVVVPQTIVVEQYWDEIMGALVGQSIEVSAVTLHVDVDEHLRRIETDMLSRPADDPGRVPAARWREARRKDYDAALPWLRAKTRVLDTTGAQPDDVARMITSEVLIDRRGEGARARRGRR